VAEQAWNTERIVRLVALALLGLACLQIIIPFLGAIAWAGIIAITIWPAFVWLSERLGRRPRLAAGICGVGLMAILVLPFAIMAATLGQAIPEAARLMQGLAVEIAPQAPPWIRDLPLVGSLLDEMWRNAVTDMTGLVRRALPAAEQAGVWALAQGANLMVALLEFLFAILIAVVLLVTAERFADLAQRIVARLDIGDGGRIIGIVVSTVRSVSIGLVGTASVQALVAAIGFAIAGLPAIAVLGFLVFVLALIQLPTLLIWVPAAVWLYIDGRVAAAIFLGVWGLVLINSVDNFLRPWLISRGAQLPFALILMGVLGGLLAWGIIGLFIGPTLLAVAYSLIRTWTGDAEAKVAAAPPAAPS
jgi:predicted PurR-regulated permease PerM